MGEDVADHHATSVSAREEKEPVAGERAQSTGLSVHLVTKEVMRRNRSKKYNILVKPAEAPMRDSMNICGCLHTKRRGTLRRKNPHLHCGDTPKRNMEGA